MIAQVYTSKQFIPYSPDTLLREFFLCFQNEHCKTFLFRQGRLAVGVIAWQGRLVIQTVLFPSTWREPVKRWKLSSVPLHRTVC